jgi:hypothetical protein
METIMSTLALPGATAALATAEPRAAPGPLPRLLAAARVRQRTHNRRYLGRQSDARSVALGFDAAEIAALGQGSLQLPTHQATPTSA